MRLEDEFRRSVLGVCAGGCQGQVPEVWASAGGRKQQGSGQPSSAILPTYAGPQWLLPNTCRILG